MALEYAPLSDQPFSRIHRAFCEAFADYALDMSYLTAERLENRLIKNGVDFDVSVGVFAEGRMVAFTLIGLDLHDGVPAVFDAATGVVPAYQGQGIARQMFDFARPRLAERGVRKFLLEVLTVNEAAIKAYRAIGFRVRREFLCFKADHAAVQLPAEVPFSVEIRSVDPGEAGNFARFLDWQPSWENSFSAIARIPDEVFLHGAFVDGRPVGLGVYYPGLQWIMSLVVDPSYRRRGIATSLLGHIFAGPAKGVSEVKIVNVDTSDKGTAALLTKAGFELYVRQFEMELALD